MAGVPRQYLCGVLIFYVLFITRRSVASCFLPLGMESRGIPDSNITSSSATSNSPAFNARLNALTQWYATYYKDKQPWIQIYLNRKKKITRIATQGPADFVKQYYVAYSTDGITWLNYSRNGQVVLFPGNTRYGNTYTVTNNLTSPISTQYFRLYPTQCSSQNYCGLRMELYGCDLVSPAATTSPPASFCTPLQSPQGGQVTCTNNNMVGSMCSFSCSSGYKLDGTGRLTCQSDGSWTAKEPVCQKLPGKPTNVRSSSITGDSITLTWTAAAAGSSSITGYDVRYHPQGDLGSSREKNVQHTTASLASLKPFTYYVITVTAISADGSGPPSDSVQVRTKESAPDMVSSLTVTARDPLSLDVSWTPLTSDQWNGAPRGYRLYYYKSGSTDMKTVNLSAVKRSYKIEPLDANTEYIVRVAGYNSAGVGPPKSSSGNMVKEGAPTVPRNVRIIKAEKKSVELTWDKPEKTNGNLKHYVVRYTYRLSGSSVTYVKNLRYSDYSANTVKYNLDGLEEFTKYYITVSAKTSVEGLKSAVVTATTLEDVPDEQPEISSDSVAIDAYRIQIKWKVVPPPNQNGVITGYVVYYQEGGCSSGKVYLQKNVTGEKNLETVVTGLKPYTDYGIKVKARNRVGLDRTPLYLVRCVIIKTSQAGPSAPRDVKAEAISSTQVYLSWSEPLLLNGELLQYRIYNNTRIEDLHKEYVDAKKQLSMTVGHLKEHTKYFFQIRAMTQKPGNFSKIVSVTTLEDTPGPPQSLACTALSDHNIELKWKNPSEPNGIIRNYFISVYYNGTQNLAGNYSTNGNHTERFVKGLKPWISYRIIVRGYTIGVGEEASCTVRTKEGDASPPPDVKATLQEKLIKVTWKEPKHHNGILKGYIVVSTASRPYDSSFNPKTQETLVPVDTTETELNLLDPGTTYTIYVLGITGKERRGKESIQVDVETPAIAPPQPPNPNVDEKDVTDTTITISLTEASQENGKVIAHQVIVEESSTETRVRRSSKYPSNLKSWKAAQEMGLPYYIAAEWANKPIPAKFVVGDGKYYGKYYNAPLKSDSQYSVRLRAATKDRDGKWLYSEGKAIRLPRTAVTAAPVENDSNVGAIAGVIGGVVMVAVIVVVFLLYKRSTLPLNANMDVENAKGKKHKGLELRRLSGKKRAPSFTGEPTNDPDHPPIVVEHFAKHVTKLHKSDDRGFMIEYNKLDSGRDYPCEAAHTAENKQKNRYGNIVAYDHSRVLLKRAEESEESDYINASHIDGYNKPNAYIATQGPVPPTFDDFWQMVWDQQSSTIVMLTNLQERHKLKCHKYWPDEKEEYGDIVVTLIKEEHYADYVIRTFNVKKESEKEEREVKQFHFTVWPDHGVPEYATAILAFRRRVRAYNPPDTGPMIIHCSAGVGRSGTFIVIDTILDRINAEATIDIFNYVAYLRNRRTAMVQTEEQYVFCHDAILEAIQCGNTQILAHDLRIMLRKMDEVDKELKMNRFEAEFKTLNRVSPVLPKACFIVSSYPENREKNRHQDILASDYARVILTAIDDNEITTYINAVLIAGYKQQHAFIVTQYPLTNTITDFWRMLCEQQSACIVTLKSPEEQGDFPQFWPEDELQTHDDMITVEPLPMDSSSVDNLNQRYNSEDVLERKFKLTDLRSPEKNVVVKQFQLTSWPDENEPPATSTMIAMIAKVEKWQQQSGNGPITVLCSDGISRSGTFCALYSVLERVKIEQVVDVFQAIKAMRIQQQGLVKTVSQYRFIHYGVQEYLMAFDDYANFK